MHARWQDLDFEKYHKSFSYLCKTTRVTKFRDFQYKLILGKIVLNSDLFSWHMKVTDKCSWCNTEWELTLHFFYHCKIVAPLITWLQDVCKVNDICSRINDIDFVLNTSNDNPTHVINFISIFMKQYMYKNRCLKRKPTLNGFLIELELHHKIEYTIVINECKLGKHMHRWSPIYKFEPLDNQPEK